MAVWGGSALRAPSRRGVTAGPARRGGRPRALLADVAPLGTAAAPVATSEVVVVFASTAPLAAAPECLAGLALPTAVQPAPALLAASHSARLDAAACLASPIVPEENAAEIVRGAAAELQARQQAHLQLRYANEVRLAGAGGSQLPSLTRRRSNLQERLVISCPVAQQAVQETLEAHAHKNRLVLEGPRELPKPDAGIVLAEPDHASLLASCLDSLDQD